MTPSFTLRPFPPPSLANIPLDYVLAQLQVHAPHYWNKSETADCTIIVPVPHQYRSRQDPSSLDDDESSEPTIVLPCISMKLHIDYLSAQSSFLRGIFSGSSPLDDHTDASVSPAFHVPPYYQHSHHYPHRRDGTGPHDGRGSPLATTAPAEPVPVPENRLPRLLPSSSAEHPVLFVPVPDPTTFALLVHWMYFGETAALEDALWAGGVARLEGVARNAEYLGLRPELGQWLGRWYTRWVYHHQHRHYHHHPYHDSHLHPPRRASPSKSMSTSSVSSATSASLLSPLSPTLLLHRLRMLSASPPSSLSSPYSDDEGEEGDEDDDLSSGSYMEDDDEEDDEGEENRACAMQTEGEGLSDGLPLPPPSPSRSLGRGRSRAIRALAHLYLRPRSV